MHALKHGSEVDRRARASYIHVYVVHAFKHRSELKRRVRASYIHNYTYSYVMYMHYLKIDQGWAKIKKIKKIPLFLLPVVDNVPKAPF